MKGRRVLAIIASLCTLLVLVPAFTMPTAALGEGADFPYMGLTAQNYLSKAVLDAGTKANVTVNADASVTTPAASDWDIYQINPSYYFSADVSALAGKSYVISWKQDIWDVDKYGAVAIIGSYEDKDFALGFDRATTNIRYNGKDITCGSGHTGEHTFAAYCRIESTSGASSIYVYVDGVQTGRCVLSGTVTPKFQMTAISNWYGDVTIRDLKMYEAPNAEINIATASVLNNQWASNCTFNSNGSITIAQGGDWGPEAFQDYYGFVLPLDNANAALIADKSYLIRWTQTNTRVNNHDCYSVSRIGSGPNGQVRFTAGDAYVRVYYGSGYHTLKSTGNTGTVSYMVYFDRAASTYGTYYFFVNGAYIGSWVMTGTNTLMYGCSYSFGNGTTISNLVLTAPTQPVVDLIGAASATKTIPGMPKGAINYAINAPFTLKNNDYSAHYDAYNGYLPLGNKGGGTDFTLMPEGISQTDEYVISLRYANPGWSRSAGLKIILGQDGAAQQSLLVTEAGDTSCYTDEHGHVTKIGNFWGGAIIKIHVKPYSDRKQYIAVYVRQISDSNIVYNEIVDADASILTNAFRFQMTDTWDYTTLCYIQGLRIYKVDSGATSFESEAAGQQVQTAGITSQYYSKNKPAFATNYAPLSSGIGYRTTANGNAVLPTVNTSAGTITLTGSTNGFGYIAFPLNGLTNKDDFVVTFDISTFNNTQGVGQGIRAWLGMSGTAYSGPALEVYGKGMKYNNVLINDGERSGTHSITLYVRREFTSSGTVRNLYIFCDGGLMYKQTNASIAADPALVLAGPNTSTNSFTIKNLNVYNPNEASKMPKGATNHAIDATPTYNSYTNQSYDAAYGYMELLSGRNNNNNTNASEWKIALPGLTNGKKDVVMSFTLNMPQTTWYSSNFKVRVNYSEKDDGSNNQWVDFIASASGQIKCAMQTDSNYVTINKRSLNVVIHCYDTDDNTMRCTDVYIDGTHVLSANRLGRVAYKFRVTGSPRHDFQTVFSGLRIYELNPNATTFETDAVANQRVQTAGTPYYTVSATTSGSGTVNGTGPFKYGSTTTLRAVAGNGYTFQYLMVNGRAYVKDEPITVPVTGHMTVNARFCQNSGATSYTVTFLTADDRVVQQTTSNGTFNTNNLPAVPTRYGYVAHGWDYVFEDGVSSDINVHPVYVKDTTKPRYTVAVHDGTINMTNVLFETQVTATANDTANFVCWVDGNNTLLSTSPTYTFFITHGMNLYAKTSSSQVYGVRVDNVSRNEITGTNLYRATIVGATCVTSGYTIMERGIVYKSGDSSNLTVGATGVKKKVSTTTGNDQFMYTLNNCPVGTAIYAKTYMLVRNNSTGGTTYVYSPGVCNCTQNS